MNFSNSYGGSRVDAFDSVVELLRAVSVLPFSYKGHKHTKKPLKIDSSIFLEMSCEKRCAACCAGKSIDYIPEEHKPGWTTERLVEVNGKEFVIVSDMQFREGLFCRHVQTSSGKCIIEPIKPLACDFRFIKPVEGLAGITILNQLPATWWMNPRIDGGKGPVCRFTDPTPQSKDRVLGLFIRLKKWADYLEIETVLEDIVVSIDQDEYVGKLF